VLGWRCHPVSGRASSISPYDLTIGLIVFPAQELHELLDVDIHQINAQHLPSVGPHADNEIRPANTIENQKAAVVTSDREPLGAILHISS
jgi:hypothetical protein